MQLLVPALSLLAAAHAGEVVLYEHPTCPTSYTTKLAADASAPCTRFANNAAQVQAVSTGRNIGPACTFSLFTDAKCAHLARAVASAGPAHACLAMPAGALAYSVACGAARGGALAQPSGVSSSIITYLQPRVQFRGNASGDTDVFPDLDLEGAARAAGPAGSVTAAGAAIAKAVFAQALEKAYSQAFAVGSGGTQYRVVVQGYRSNRYTVLQTLAAVGEAAFASLMADTVAGLVSSPRTYHYFELVNEDYLDEEIGTVNVTYT